MCSVFRSIERGQEYAATGAFNTTLNAPPALWSPRTPGIRRIRRSPAFRERTRKNCKSVVIANALFFFFPFFFFHFQVYFQDVHTYICILTILTVIDRFERLD